MAPLGYDTKDRKITVNQAEAERVRTIFRSYLKLGSLNLLMAELRQRGIVTKVRTLRTGETVGGIPFSRGPRFLSAPGRKSLKHWRRGAYLVGNLFLTKRILEAGLLPFFGRLQCTE